eukprot:15446430-Alexandrium_andersonii.AAC.1
MVSRSALLMCYLVAKSCKFLLEQPLSSLMPKHPRMLFLQKMSVDMPALFQWQEITTFMGGFGAPTAKPSRLFSNAEWLDRLHRVLPPGFVAQDNVQTSVVGTKGAKKTVTGGPDLKETQAYTTDFGMSVCRAWEEGLRAPATSDPDDDLSVSSEGWSEDEWEDTAHEGL